MLSSNFSLSDPEFPVEMLSEDGNRYPIASDHKTILSCLNVVSDPDVPEIKKALFVAKRFFCGNPPPDMGALFVSFVVDDGRDDDGEQLIDFQQDAGVIYASFRQQYGIDLAKETLHWWAFRMLLSGLGEGTALGSRVQLRTLDLDAVSEKDRSKFRRLKDMVAIVPRMSAEEAALQEELDRRLAAGEDPAEIIEKLKGV